MEFKTQFSTKYFHIPTGVDAIPNVLGGCVLCNVYVCSIFCRRRQRCCCCLAVAILYAIYLDFFFFLLFFCGLLLSFEIHSHFCINPMSIHWSTDTTTEYDMVHINLFNSYENIIIVTVCFFAVAVHAQPLPHHMHWLILNFINIPYTHTSRTWTYENLMHNNPVWYTCHTQYPLIRPHSPIIILSRFLRHLQ